MSFFTSTLQTLDSHARMKLPSGASRRKIIEHIIHTAKGMLVGEPLDNEPDVAKVDGKIVCDTEE